MARRGVHQNPTTAAPHRDAMHVWYLHASVGVVLSSGLDQLGWKRAKLKIQNLSLVHVDVRSVDLV
jgi:hypothetical protein